MKSIYRFWLTMIITILVIITTTWFFGEKEGFLWSLILFLLYFFAMYFYGPKFLLQKLKAKELEGQDSWSLLLISRELAQRARIDTPKVFIIPIETPTILSISRNSHNSSILISKGFLDNFHPREISAAMAYEIARIHSGDSSAFCFFAVFSSFCLFIPLCIDRIFLLKHYTALSTKRSRHIAAYFTSIILGLLQRIIACPKNYLENDTMAASLINDSRLIATVLWKLDSYSFTKPFKIDAALSSCFIVNPLTRDGWNRYFHTQVDLKKRITNLLGHYPL